MIPTTLWMHFISLSGSIGCASSPLTAHCVLAPCVGVVCLAGECWGFIGTGCYSLLIPSGMHFGIDRVTCFGVDLCDESNSKPS